MSDKPISVGDLVAVIKPRRCGCDDSVGQIFQVEWIGVDGRPGKCMACGSNTFQPASITAKRVDGGYVELHRLRRIPPLSELEGERTQEEMKEPA
jgi:hypothetical protein